MPKGPRIYIDYACYHIITRGNQRQKVFMCEEDYEKYLHIVKKAKKKYRVNIYAYCLMPNHIHMLIEVDPVRSMSKFMQWINRGYTAYFNVRHKKIGHLWQGRFKGKPVLKGDYLIQCATYIEANPLRANMVSGMADYKWSSYKQRCLEMKPGGLIDYYGGHC